MGIALLVAASILFHTISFSPFMRPEDCNKHELLSQIAQLQAKVGMLSSKKHIEEAKKMGANDRSLRRAPGAAVTQAKPEKIASCTDYDFEHPLITRALFINMNSSHDRRDHMEDMLEKASIPYERVEAVRPKSKPTKHGLKLGEYGVWLGHQAAWRAAIRNGDKYTLIMEDDAQLGENTNNQYLNWTCAVPKDNHMLFFASRGVLQHKPLPGCAPHLNVAQNFPHGYSMIAYVVTQAGAKKLLASEAGPRRIPVDGYPFVDWNDGLKVYVNMGLHVSWHTKLNDESVKKLVTDAAKGAAIVPAVKKECLTLAARNNVEPGRSWGTLSPANQTRWHVIKCDLVVLKGANGV
jgi:GR25 family glycosyltransferase involved in LPS biosynthesis